ncbi:hypothetical protein [Saccharopolyspora sp. SCSIO 74807]|uniref:hypothetical protein n=1 Tax=Saccharopolyspora sp. SCSIO 74807 TaxID=3118084 RepID=UPI0030D3AFF7
MTDARGSGGLTDAERALLAAYRQRRRTAPPSGTSPASGTAPPDADERLLLQRWSWWRDRPLSRPPWFAALRQRIVEPEPPTPATGLAGPDGYLPEAASRFAGMLLGAAAAEHTVLGRLGERTTSVLFALEGLIRAHTALRVHGTASPPLPSSVDCNGGCTLAESLGRTAFPRPAANRTAGWWAGRSCIPPPSTSPRC